MKKERKDLVNHDYQDLSAETGANLNVASQFEPSTSKGLENGFKVNLDPATVSFGPEISKFGVEESGAKKQLDSEFSPLTEQIGQSVTKEDL